jgi:hypothetical protein
MGLYLQYEHLGQGSIQNSKEHIFRMVLIIRLIILSCSSGLHDHPRGEWVDLGVAASAVVPHVPQDEAKTCSHRQCALFHVSVCLVASLSTS